MRRKLDFDLRLFLFATTPFQHFYLLQTVPSTRTPVLYKRSTNAGVNIGDDDWLVDDISDSKKRKRPSTIEEVNGRNSVNGTKKSKNIENQGIALSSSR